MLAVPTESVGAPGFEFRPHCQTQHEARVDVRIIQRTMRDHVSHMVRAQLFH